VANVPSVISHHRSSLSLGDALSNSRAREGGFTLLELLVVVLIIGLLSALVGPKLFGQVEKSQQRLAASQIDAFGRALAAFRLDTGRFPTSEEGLASLRSAPSGLAKWNGPYIDKPVPLDPWDRPYTYRMPGTDGKDFDISSLGKDGAAGGAGDAADITNK